MHKCPGPACEAQVPADQLACRRHWYQVSEATRGRVWREYRLHPGSDAHAAAMDQAIAEMKP